MNNYLRETFSLRGKSLFITLPFRQKQTFDKPIPEYLYGLVFIALIILSVGAWLFYYKQGLTLTYNDARSHLNVARRVFDSLQPGFAQIGSVWLPLYHILELPFIWSDFLWRTGLAGSIISMISYILGGYYLVKLAIELKLGRLGTLVTFAVYALNPNLIYMQTTPMTEALLILLSTATVYHLVRWVKRYEVVHLILAAFFTYLATLTRYDGWFLLMFVILTIFYITYKRRGFGFAEGTTLFFLTLAGFGVLLWFLWNTLIFGDPLFFVFGPFSAKAQQDILLSEGRLLTKGNLIYSTFVYLITAIYNLGIWVFLLSIGGLVFFLRSKKIATRIKLTSLLLSVPFFFNVISLWAGHSVIHLPRITPYTWFNDRYGLMILPFSAIFLGYLVKGKKLAFWLVALVLFIQTLSMYLGNDVITIQDGVRGASGAYLDDASTWISENADDGLILVAASANDALLFKSGLKLKQFITEGAREYWDTSMEDPTIYAKWIVMHKGDLVEKNLKGNELFLTNYRLVYKDAFTYIYLLDKNSDKMLSEKELPS